MWKYTQISLYITLLYHVYINVSPYIFWQYIIEVIDITTHRKGPDKERKGSATQVEISWWFREVGTSENDGRLHNCIIIKWKMMERWVSCQDWKTTSHANAWMWPHLLPANKQLANLQKSPIHDITRQCRFLLLTT